jgi:putative acetyltransferase
VLDEAGTVGACIGVAPLDGPVTPALRAAGDVERVVELKRLYGAAEVRRHGLGAALVARVETWTRAHGADAIVLWSDTRFTGAHRLYERLGYERTGQQRELHDPSDTVEDQFVRLL